MSVNQGAVDFAEKLVRIMGAVGYVQKDATNEHFKYKYASADAVLTKVRDACSENGVAVESKARLERLEIIGTKTFAVVHISITLTDGIGQAVIEGLGSGIDSGDKSVMKANTAALKYAMSSGFLISWGDDPEADRDTDEANSNVAIVGEWLISCAGASNTSADKFKQWWPVHKTEIKKACGDDGAAEVYSMFNEYLKRLSKEAAE